MNVKPFGIWFLGQLLLCWGRRQCKTLIASPNKEKLIWTSLDNCRWVTESNADFIIEDEILHVIGDNATTSYSGLTDKTKFLEYKDSFPTYDKRCVYHTKNGDVFVLGSNNKNTNLYHFKDDKMTIKKEFEFVEYFHKCYLIPLRDTTSQEYYLLTMRQSNKALIMKCPNRYSCIVNNKDTFEIAGTSLDHTIDGKFTRILSKELKKNLRLNIIHFKNPSILDFDVTVEDTNIPHLETDTFLMVQVPESFVLRPTSSFREEL